MYSIYNIFVVSASKILFTKESCLEISGNIFVCSANDNSALLVMSLGSVVRVKAGLCCHS